ncbi:MULTISPECIES: branched-chain amino acid ABC transporter permease [unclassified Rathayibacter]|uniref:branched-chain amino acid ABC transporter permease n=1 Tax=unclassified Rathayibacter TaxID=2609250 RepID=UPI00188D9456|nr:MULTISPECIES: branched-chain amino acid ABC transporter permease [unclassified Rathayibacter]MBF4461649.1 branched-chain amino acid ABC transporter permease [Rathayibacter sp. VKM Ac-2879]MBF4503060.1 branched-chain amino acid ABC transporter permease [Rathayibacter sp. VKM Ac-2878]
MDRRRPRLRNRLIALGLLAAALTGVAAAAPAASAATTDQSIIAWVRVQGTNENLAGVTVEIAGDASGTMTTGEDGRATFPLDAAGTYTVTVDEDSLPADKGYPAAGQNPKQVKIVASQKQIVNFIVSTANPRGAGAVAPVPSGSASPSSPATQGTTGNDATNPDGTSNQVSQPVSADTFWIIFWPKVVTGLIFGLLIALAAIGASLIYGVTGLNNFAHGELVTFGALMAYLFSGVLGLPALVAIPIAVVLGGAFGYVQDGLLWKPLRKKGIQLIPLMIVTIGLSLALRYVFVFFFGADRLSLPNSTAPFLTIPALGISLKFTDIVGAVIGIVCIVGVAFVLTKTKIGKAMRAVSDNRALASASGINVERVIRVVWVMSGALAALAGVYIGFYQSLRWDTGASILLLIFAAITLGGLGSAYGALVGSLIIGLMMNISTIWIPENLKYVAPLILMIIILLVRPQGILGRKERIG